MKKDRTDLPHDQVNKETTSQMSKDQDIVQLPSIGYDERSTGMSKPMGVTEENSVFNTNESTRQNAPTEIYPETKITTGLNEKRPYADRDTTDVEAAAEVSPVVSRPAVQTERDEEFPKATNDRPLENNDQVQNIETMENTETGGAGLGWTALVLSIISLFFLPLLTASIGVITGFFAFRNGARTLGMWAMAIGLFSIVMGLFFTPFVR